MEREWYVYNHAMVASSTQKIKEGGSMCHVFHRLPYIHTLSILRTVKPVPLNNRPLPNAYLLIHWAYKSTPMWNHKTANVKWTRVLWSHYQKNSLSSSSKPDFGSTLSQSKLNWQCISKRSISFALVKILRAKKQTWEPNGISLFTGGSVKYTNPKRKIT